MLEEFYGCDLNERVLGNNLTREVNVCSFKEQSTNLQG